MWESDDKRDRAVALAYRAVASCDRTEEELRSFLDRRGVASEDVEFAVADLTRAGYLGDDDYAARFVADKRSIEGWGRERIARTLARKGVVVEAVEAALGEVTRDEELAAARGLLRERFREPLLVDRERDRAWRLLVRRGYHPELAYEAVRGHEPRP